MVHWPKQAFKQTPALYVPSDAILDEDYITHPNQLKQGPYDEDYENVEKVLTQLLMLLSPKWVGIALAHSSMSPHIAWDLIDGEICHDEQHPRSWLA